MPLREWTVMLGRKSAGKGALAGVTVAAALVAAAASHATPVNPEAVDGPLANRVWAGCRLDGTTANRIKSHLKAGTTDINDSQVDVTFVVVYSFKYANNGQPLVSGGTTGPVVCLAPNIRVEKTKEEEDIPTAEDQGAGVLNVDMLDLSEALLIRYGYDGSTRRINENRFCHTVANPATGTPGSPPPETNTDCFRIYPKP